MEYSLNQIVNASGGKLVRADGLADRPLRIVTDSREASPDTVFWALHGDAYDGHSFINAAIDNGASACVVSTAWSDKNTEYRPEPLVEVADTLQALADLAAWNRQRWPLRVIGITGSFGKTTTREMLHAVISQRFETLRSPKNFNNHFGVPLTLLQIESRHEVAIVELGASACGEIRRLAQIASPDTGIITGTGLAHAAQFGGPKAIIRAKGELAEAIPGRGLLLLCGDDESSKSFEDRSACRVVKVGTGVGKEAVNDLIASEVVQVGETLKVTVNDSVFSVKASGRHFARSVLFAVAVARDLGMSDNDIQQGLDRYVPVAGRCNVRQLPSCTVIDDCYNSSPEAMQAAIAVLAGQETRGQRILVTGDMLMLGENAESRHRDVGVTAASSGVDHIFAIGQFGRDIVAGAIEAGFDPQHATTYTCLDRLLEELGSVLSASDVVLVKGSRATHMERVIDWLEALSTTLPSEQANQQEATRSTV